MKLYAIYRIRNRNNIVLDVPELYAFSTDKKKIDEFLKERKMKYFFLKEKEIDKKMYKEFKNRYNRKELRYESLYTRNDINPNGKQVIHVLGTWDEIEDSSFRSDSKIFGELTKYVSPIIFSLKAKYVEALEILYYLEVCRFSWMEHFPTATKHMFDGLMGGGDIDRYGEQEIIRSNLEYDEFAFYMYFHGWMYK